MSTQGKRGFTLIELLVVIAIIGILSSVVLASLNSARVKGRDARRLADIKQLQTALELYYNDNQAYPTSGTAANVGTALTGLVPNYISTMPNDPSGGTNYYYYISGGTPAGSYYCIGAKMEGTVTATSTCKTTTVDPANSTTYKVGP